MPPGHGLLEHHFDSAHPVLGFAHDDIVRHGLTRHRRHRVICRNFQLPVAQRSFADVQLDLSQHPTVRFSQFINRHFGDRYLRHDLIRLNPITVIRRWKPIDKYLPQFLVHSTGVLAGCQLNQTFGVGHLDPHGTVVSHPQPTAVPQRAHRHHPQGFRPHREATQRRLRLDHNPPDSFDRLVELHFQFPFAIGHLHAPSQHGFARHGKHLAGSVEGEG